MVLRALLVAGIALLGLLEGQSLLRVFGSAADGRERRVRSLREPLASARLELERALNTGGPRACLGLLVKLLPAAAADEIEVRDAEGRLLAAVPIEAPVEHQLTFAERQTLAVGDVVAVGPLAGRSPRLLVYLGLPGARGHVVRVAVEAADLLEQLRERHALVVSHAVGLGLLFVAAMLALLPGREPPLLFRQPAGAYEEAVARLAASGQEAARRHEAELRRLEEATRDLEVLARAGELTAGMVHEVRNGLATILGYARLMESGGAAAQDAARSIHEECQQLESVVRRFADFVKRDELRLEPLELGRLLERVVAHETRGREGPAVQVSAPAAVVVLADEALLERAFENLVRNALQAARSQVSISVGSGGTHAEVLIVDDGPGLPEDLRGGPRPFATTKPGGLGLGLPLAVKLVRLHRGRLELVPGSPRGLMARVLLPLEAATDRSAAAGSENSSGIESPA